MGSCRSLEGSTSAPQPVEHDIPPLECYETPWAETLLKKSPFTETEADAYRKARKEALLGAPKASRWFEIARNSPMVQERLNKVMAAVFKRQLKSL